MRFTLEQYNEVIKNIELAKLQLEPNGENCSICGDNDHQVFECRFNPLVALERQDLFKCYYCGKYLNSTEAEEHFKEENHQEDDTSTFNKTMNFSVDSVPSVVEKGKK